MFGPKTKFGSKKILGPSNFSQKILFPKKFRSKNISNQTKFWSKKMLVQKIMGPQNIGFKDLVKIKKKFGSQKIVVPKN